MFTCFWKMWDWLDPRAMENKKCFIDNEGILGDPPVIGNSSDSGPLMKPQMHNTASQNLKLVQHGAKSARSFCSQSVVHQHSPAVWGGIIPMQHSASVHYHQHGQYPNSRHWQGHIPPGHDSAPSGFDKHFVKPFEPVRNNKMKNSASNNGVAQFQLGTPKKLSQDIIMQGWLHKQGSEGLKVWRKRWFVLSDYCLYYYKGPDEDKVLGSILLPSYKVSLCGSDDKVYRKFAFKCEHANMRTYYLAADSHEVMMNWIRALNMACMLQSNTETVSQYGSNMLPVRNLPVHLQMCNNEPPAAPGQVVQNADMTNASMGSNPSNNSGNGIQPVYANAPPKPRRLTDGSGYSSPSPEYSIYHNNQHMYPYNEHGCSKSPVNMYSRNCDNTLSSCTPPSHNPGRVYYNTVHDYHMQTIPQPDNSGSLVVAGPTIISNVERRTPDTYGRSKLNVNKIKVASDYEDVYSDEVMYKRPLSPVAYSNIKKVSPVASINVQHRPYTPVYISGATLPVDHMRKPVTPQLNTVPRPHSADFLEYEVKHRNNANKVNVANSQQPRPKSSLDITQTPGDNYYYSKESYAESMRKSALYLQQLPVHYHSKSGEHLVMLNGPKMYQRPKKDKHLTTNDGVLSEETSIDMNVCSSPYSKSPVCLRGPEESDYLMDPGNKHVSYCSGSNFFMNDRDIMEHECDVPPQNYEDQFKRSSSARLLRSDHPVHLMHPVHPVHQVYPVHVAHEEVYNTVPVHRDGEQKREESMKRLLEWKQRMLQSPLNRKISSRSVNVGVPRTVTSRPEYLMPPHCKQTKSDSYNVHDSRSLPTFVDSGCSLSQYNSYSSDDEASGSICVMTPTHDTFPRAMSKRMWSPAGLTPSRSVTLHPRDSSSDYARCPSNAHMYLHPVHQQSPVPHVGHHCSGVPKAAWQWNGRINMSAGELLGRTHEELVLLLIQLRRQSTSTCHAIESCYTEISHIQSQMNNMDAAKRMENLQKLEQLKQHLLELEKQYEKGKPLVNLVDNMVKLGSLYRNPNDQNDGLHVRDRLEFNQQIQEQRLLAEERRNWNRLSPNHMQLQTKVQQLYQLDRLLQEESDTLQGLQHDKEKIEKALGGLRLQLNKGYKNPIEIEHARKEQIRLENELSRVHYMLAQNSKKLEETVAGNARLEQELLVLRQKLQLSRQQRSSVQFSNTGGSVGDSLPCAAGTSAMLENELHRVQQLVGDLQRQRHELSAQVRQLTDRSHTLSQQIRPSFTPLHLSSMNNKKRITTFWRETDLDTMVSVDHGLDSDLENKSFGTMPLYANAETTKAESNSGFHKAAEGEYHYPEEKQLQNFDKPEIKTVRIVKRESERRQRDREKINNTVTPDNSSSPQKWDSVLEEEDLPVNVSSLERVEGSINDTQFDAQVFKHMPLFSDSNNFLNRQASVSSPSLSSQMDAYMNDTHSCSSNHTTVDKSPALSPVFKSEAARQIIIEMSGVSSEPSTLKNSARRMIPKEKRRHYTAPHNNLIMKSLGTLPTDSSYNGTNAVNRRARDDLDMERALRQRTDTPDVVRSTMSTKELKYNENTIDNILGTPNKINIPERYIPEQLPQLSLEEQQHRLRKVESIKKMLSDTAILSSVQSTSLPSGNAETDTTGSNNNNANPKENTVCDVSTMAKATSKMVEEKRQREHLLQLNQILAQQVMEMSKIVAVKALASLPVEHQTVSVDEDDLSPVTPLPLYQQRDNYFT